jgi:hypothetical protein
VAHQAMMMLLIQSHGHTTEGMGSHCFVFRSLQDKWHPCVEGREINSHVGSFCNDARLCVRTSLLTFSTTVENL